MSQEPFDKIDFPWADHGAASHVNKDVAGSEPQEWTGSIGGLLTDANRKPIAVALNIENAKTICAAHKAALKSAYEKGKQDARL
jgi:hypothetical protein